MKKVNKKIKKDILTFNTVFLEENDGGYSVSVPALPGCFSQGDSFEEAVKNISEAIELYLEDEKNLIPIGFSTEAKRSFWCQLNFMPKEFFVLDKQQYHFCGRVVNG